MNLVTVGALTVLAVTVVVALTIDRILPDRRPLGLHAGRRAQSFARWLHLVGPAPAGAVFAELSVAEAVADIARRLTELEQLAEASPAEQLSERLTQLEQRIARLEGHSA